MASTRYAYTAAGLLALAVSVKGQAACTLTTETHPSLSWEACSSDGTCSTVSGSVAVDANWRWTHDKTSSTNCYTGNTWDATLCPDDETCFENCCVDGAEYESTYGVTSSGSALTLDFVTGSNIGSRLYLLANDTSYQGFTLLGNEFTFDVDVSNLPCGLNGALYFVSMDLDGGISKYNNSGPSYGTGYCDSQCPRDLKFIAGEANVDSWVSSTTNSNTGVGGHGACCAEMDVWEANKISNALTPHPCKTSSYHECDGDDCGGTYSSTRYAGDCDPDGCDFNPYRQGNETFYGPSMTVDTSSVITVITQFVEESGALSAIRRFYVQNDVVIDQSESVVSGVTGYNEINADYCSAQKTAFGDDNIFAARGGFSAFSTAVSSPMVLVMSLWDDYYADMLWLDSTYPTNSTSLGATRGTCATDSGVPSEVEADSASSKVIYSNIKFGPIGSTTSYTLTDSDSNTGSASSSAAAVVASSATTQAATSAVSSAEVATSAAETVATSAATSVASVVSASTDVASTSVETTVALTSSSVSSETTTAAASAATTTKKTCKRRIQTLAA